MIRKFLSIAILGILLVGCKDNSAEPTQIEETQTATEVLKEEIPAENNDSVQQAETIAQPQQPASAGPFIQQQQPQQTTPATGQTAPGFSGKPNPAHGQPGHRCDIKVGDILP